MITYNKIYSRARREASLVALPRLLIAMFGSVAYELHTYEDIAKSN